MTERDLRRSLSGLRELAVGFVLAVKFLFSKKRTEVPMDDPRRKEVREFLRERGK